MRTRDRIAEAIKFFVLLADFMMFFVFYMTFCWAYFQTGKQGILRVNAFGEADIEMVLMTGLFALNFIVLPFIFKDVFNKEVK